MLWVNVISTPYPPRYEPPENVICGPGLLLQSYAEKSAEMETGIGRVVLLMCGNDDDVAAKDGDVMGATDRPMHPSPRRPSPHRHRRCRTSTTPPFQSRSPSPPTSRRTTAATIRDHRSRSRGARSSAGTASR